MFCEGSGGQRWSVWRLQDLPQHHDQGGLQGLLQVSDSLRQAGRRYPVCGQETGSQMC